MRKTLSLLLTTAALYSSLNASGLNLNVSQADDGSNNYSFSLGDYYRVPVSEVVNFERSIPQDDLGVLYYLAQQSGRSPQYISDLRLRGASWWDISSHLGLNPEVIYVDKHSHKKHKKGRWHDREVTEFINTRFISNYYHISPDEVVSRRNKGERYMQIDKHYRDQKPHSHKERKSEHSKGDKGKVKFKEKRDNDKHGKDKHKEKHKDKRD